jgi:hypothetical protein
VHRAKLSSLLPPAGDDRLDLLDVRDLEGAIIHPSSETVEFKVRARELDLSGAGDDHLDVTLRVGDDNRLCAIVLAPRRRQEPGLPALITCTPDPARCAVAERVVIGARPIGQGLARRCRQNSLA